jgi:hypothetical protein
MHYEPHHNLRPAAQGCSGKSEFLAPPVIFSPSLPKYAPGQWGIPH